LVIAFAALLLQVAPAFQVVPKVAVAAVSSAQPANKLPAAPVPAKSAADAAGKENGGTGTLLAESNAPTAQNSQVLGTIHVPELPPTTSTRIINVESMPSRRRWLLLSIADHSAAAFDAYSTRAAISRGAAESDPLIKPFAGSDGLYAAIQIAPVALDFVARRMQRSQNRIVRRTWWLPQSVSAGLFLFAGAHNLTVSGR
jgi:hypothetical protein